MILRRLIVVMGVSGSGKTTIGLSLAAALGLPFQDADPLHPRRNILRMSSGHSLTDADRAPWLTILRHWVRNRLEHDQPAVLACSMLKRRYRNRVLGTDRRIALVYLRGSTHLLRHRIATRRGHFMPPKLLASQLATLQPPAPLEHPLTIAITGSPDNTTARVIGALG